MALIRQVRRQYGHYISKTLKTNKIFKEEISNTTGRKHVGK